MRSEAGYETECVCGGVGDGVFQTERTGGVREQCL